MPAFSSVPTKSSGDPYVLAMWNTYVRDNLNKLGDRMHRVVTVAAFAALTPEDGDEVYLEVDSTNGIYWHLRYRSASGSSYKWEFLGGPPMSSAVATEETTTSNSYTALSTAGPSIALPRPGDYEITLGFTGYNGASGASARMSFDIGATPAVDADSVVAGLGAASQVASAQRTLVKTGLTAVTLTAKYNDSPGAGTAYFGNRFLHVRPVRLS